MSRILRYTLIGLMLSIACSAWATPIFSVTETYSGPVGGLYTYSYTVVVDLTSPENLWEFWIYPTAPFDNVSQIQIEDPDNSGSDKIIWDYFTDGTSFIQWFSTDPLYDFQPEQSLSGFSYDSYGVPGEIAYEGSGADNTGNPLGDYTSGPTGGATTPIPEPGTMLMMLSGLSGLGSLVYKRLRVKRT